MSLKGSSRRDYGWLCHQERAPTLSKEASSMLAFLRGPPDGDGDLLPLEAATLQPPSHSSIVLLLDKRKEHRETWNIVLQGETHNWQML